MKLSLKLPLLLVLTLVIGIAVAGTLVMRSAEDTLRRQVIDADRHSLAAYASALQSYLDGGAALLAVTASNPFLVSYASSGTVKPALHGVSEDAAVPQRSAVRRALTASTIFDSVMLLEPDGTVFLAEPYARQLSLTSSNLSSLAWVREVRSRGELVTSGLHVSPSTQRPSVAVATLVRGPDGRLAGILAATLDLRRLAAVGQVPPRGGGGSYGLITDARGLVIGHQANPYYVQDQADFRSVPAVAAALAGRTGQGEWFNSLDRERQLGAYQPLGRTGWAVVYATRTDLALAPARALGRAVAGYAVGLAVVLALAGHLLLRWALHPLATLTRAAESIAAGADPQAVSLTSHRDEVGELARSFATMQRRLAEREAELHDNARRLEDANRELESFSYSVSHDLRSPLRAIDGFSNILLEDHAGSLDEEGSELLRRIIRAATRMGLLIDDLLELSRVGRADLRREPVDVSQLCLEALAELRAGGPARSVEVRVQPGLVVDADPRLVRSLVANLLGNAWKFTSKTENARIEVVGDGGPAGLSISVCDNGVGFAMADAGRLFSPFQRLHPTTEFPGTGIGLAIVQRVVRRHSGTVTAWSEPGQGARFTFTLGPYGGTEPPRTGDAEPLASASTEWSRRST